MSGARPDPALLAAIPAQGAAETIETHGAVIVLAGDRAYKLKKPVSLGYLDFSTVDARAAALTAELELNAPHAPQIYERLAWITASPDGLRLDGDGEPVEPVLVMRRFDQDALYSALAAQGPLGPVEARALAAAVRASHDAAARRPGAGFDRVIATLEPLAQRLTARGADPARVEPLAERLARLFERRRGVLDRRAAKGFVRRCHGDLHLQNIVAINGRPVLFDALEFDEDMATTDTMYDLAFLVMDLAARGQRAEAQTVLAHYLAPEADDPGAAGAALLDPFAALRAGVRALVALDRAGADASAESSARLDLAERFIAAAEAPAMLIAVGGLSGSGKSTVAEGLGLALGGPAGLWVVKSDVERKASLGLDWSDRIPPDAYTREASRLVYARQRTKAKAALEAGARVILDAVHSHPAERAAAEALAADAGVSFAGLWLDAPPEVLKARVSARTNDPSDADIAVVDRQAGFETGEIGWRRVSANAAPDRVLAEALAAVRAP